MLHGKNEGKTLFIPLLLFPLTTSYSLRLWSREWSWPTRAAELFHLQTWPSKFLRTGWETSGWWKGCLYSCTISISLEHVFVLQLSVQLKFSSSAFEHISGIWYLDANVHVLLLSMTLFVFGNSVLFSQAATKMLRLLMKLVLNFEFRL